MIHMENRNTETIKMMYLEDRPYEKCEQYGAEHLTDVELLAVLLRTGTKGENSLRLAQKILHPPFGSEGLLSIPQWSMEQLLKIKGIGKVKSIQILCLAELARRMAKAEASLGLDFSSPDSIARYYMEDLRHKKREVMKLLLLNTRSRLISEMDVSIPHLFPHGNCLWKLCRRMPYPLFFCIIIRVEIRHQAKKIF